MFTSLFAPVLGAVVVGDGELVAPSSDATIIGYYSWNWGSGSTGPPGANAGCAFTGLTDVTQAISQYTEGASWCCPDLVGTKFLTLGGGNSAGVFTVDSLSTISMAAKQILKAGYEGVMFDVEEVEGKSSKVVNGFKAAFKNLKAAGLTIAITTSHSAPYQTDSPQVAIDLVKSWVEDENVDIISPQLYSSGQEGSPEFAETSSCADAGCSWSLYKNSVAKFAPSIVDESQYSAVVEYFSKNHSINPSGYFVWKQEKNYEITKQDLAAWQSLEYFASKDRRVD